MAQRATPPPRARGPFHAAAALLGVRDVDRYDEGQAAVELEQLADPAETGAYPAALEAAVPGPRR